MKLTRREGLKLMSATALTAAPLTALAQTAPATHVVEMMNKDPDTGERMVFRPDFLQVNPGDTVRFVPKDNGHNSLTSPDMIPAGTDGWKGKINKEIEVTLDTEGAYGYHCLPHFSLGMVGLILVGNASGNYEAVKKGKMLGQAKKRYADIFARADKLVGA